jgi:hypothetical protein
MVGRDQLDRSHPAGAGPASVCGGWLDDATRIKERSDEIEGVAGGEPSEEQFAALAEQLRASAAGLDALAGEFEAAGQPDGEQLVDDVTSTARDTAERVRELADQVEAADPDDQDELDQLGQAFEELEDSDTDIIDSVLGEGNAEFGEFGNDELARAFADNSTCREIHDLV